MTAVQQPEPTRREVAQSGSVAAQPTLLFVVNVAWFFLSHRLEIARAAIASGMSVHLAADIETNDEIEAVTRSGIHFHRLHLSRSGLHPLGEVRTVLQLLRIVRRTRPDIIHNVTAKPVIYGSLVARITRTRGIVNAIAGFGYAYGAGLRRRLMRILLERVYRSSFDGEAVRVIVQNQEDAAVVTRVCPSAARRIRMISGSGVDLRAFRATAQPGGPPLVILPARMLREKGVVEFARASGIIRSRGVPARFALVGRVDPHTRGAVSAEEIAELCAQTGVEWFGECKDMPRCLMDASIVCLPSYYREGVPKVLLEACAARRAIVTTDTPGCRDVVAHGLNGLLVPPRDPLALAEAIQRLAEDRNLRDTMGKEGRARAEREFGVDSVVRRHLEIYLELLETGGK